MTNKPKPKPKARPKRKPRAKAKPKAKPATAPVYKLHRKFFSADECERVLWHMFWVEWRAVPKWLGNFNFCIYGESGGKNRGSLPPDLQALADKMQKLVPEQEFTTAFLQKYEKGEFVKPHRDPRNNLGYTIIAVFGEFEGAESVVGKKRLQLRTGDVLVQRCNLNKLPRPLHRVSEVTSGTRYALILNTIS